VQFSEKKKLNDIEAKYLDVADLLAACNHLRTLARLDELPIFDLNLAKKKKDNKKHDKENKNSVTDLNKDNTNDNKNDSTEAKDVKGNNTQSKPKIDQKVNQRPENAQPKKDKPEKLELSDPILTHFLKIKFVVGEITACETHQEADKLLIETINIGESATRNVCSGIKAH